MYLGQSILNDNVMKSIYTAYIRSSSLLNAFDRATQTYKKKKSVQLCKHYQQIRAADRHYIKKKCGGKYLSFCSVSLRIPYACSVYYIKMHRKRLRAVAYSYIRMKWNLNSFRWPFIGCGIMIVYDHWTTTIITNTIDLLFNE